MTLSDLQHCGLREPSRFSLSPCAKNSAVRRLTRACRVATATLLQIICQDCLVCSLVGRWGRNRISLRHYPSPKALAERQMRLDPSQTTVAQGRMPTQGILNGDMMLKTTPAEATGPLAHFQHTAKATWTESAILGRCSSTV